MQAQDPSEHMEVYSTVQFISVQHSISPQLVIVQREEARKAFPQTIVVSQSVSCGGKSYPNPA